MPFTTLSENVTDKDKALTQRHVLQKINWFGNRKDFLFLRFMIIQGPIHMLYQKVKILLQIQKLCI